MAPHVPARKRIKRFIRYLVVRAAAWVVGWMPLRLARGLGRGFGALVFRLAGGERRKALASLALAFPDKDPAWRAAVVRGSFRHLGECAFELCGYRRIDGDIEGYVRVPDADRSVLDRAVGRGRGVVFVSGHVGNFELLARRFALAGYACATIAKAPTDDRTRRMVERFRSSGNLTTLWRGDPGAGKSMLRQLRRGGILGMLIDQDTDVQGVFVDFFGVPAFTPRAAADLALHTGAGVIVSFVHRRPDGGHLVSVREMAVQPTGDHERDAWALTGDLTRAIEAEIRAAPHEWVWMHQRWKTRPRAG